MNDARKSLVTAGLRSLPFHIARNTIMGKNGESLATDEAAVWKRVISYRTAAYLRPRTILETHPGLGIGTAVYRAASPRATFVSHSSALGTKTFALIDIDPFGAPWDTIGTLSDVISLADVVFVSNGEAYAVRRGLRRGQKYPSRYSGRDLPKWVTCEYLPRLERMTRLNVEFFYAFPTTVRVVLSRLRLPPTLWVGCPQWMWWLEKYAAPTAKENQRDGISS